MIVEDYNIWYFSSLKNQSDLNYEEMMFFDDEQRNISDVSKLGVTSIFVRDGVSKNVIEEGMQMFKRRQS